MARLNVKFRDGKELRFASGVASVEFDEYPNFMIVELENDFVCDMPNVLKEKDTRENAEGVPTFEDVVAFELYSE